MPKQIPDDVRQTARRLFEQGRTSREIVTALGGQVSTAWVSENSRKEGWLRGILPEDQVTADNPQIFESANATAQEMSRNTDKFQEASRRRWAAHKADLADEFGERIRQLMDRAFSPCIQKEVKVVPGPQGAGSAVQLIEVPLNLPTPADQVKLLTGVAILVDKASLLSGDATSRVETAKLSGTELDAQLKYRRDEIARRREQKQLPAGPNQEAV
jgi:hypothetical protein